MFVLSGRQVPVLFICFNALTLMFLLKILFCPDVRTKGGPGFGDAPGAPPPWHLPWPERTPMVCGSALSVSLDTGRSRSRAVSLLTGAHVPHLSFIYLKK